MQLCQKDTVFYRRTGVFTAHVFYCELCKKIKNTFIEQLWGLFLSFALLLFLYLSDEYSPQKSCSFFKISFVYNKVKLHFLFLFCRNVFLTIVCIMVSTHPLKNTTSLFFAKEGLGFLKSANCPSPLFSQSPLYIGFS